jgi:two-component system OmpR family sensor kinase/two-component system sensor histidine kinase BaeS
MNRLWVRLTLAFALVILVTVGAIALLADLTAGQVFRQYLSYTDVARFQTLTDRLVEYYVENDGWLGVDEILRQVRIMPAPGPGAMPRGPHGTIDWRDDRFFLILADAEGQVVRDGPRGQPGRKLTHDEEAAAQEIMVGDEVVGQLVIVRPMQSAIFGPMERAFVTRLRWLLIAGALLAGVLGVLLGVVLSRSLTAPLQRLATAARAVADRDFSRRVRVEGSLEMAELAEAFNEMTEALESSERQRQNMVADVAHELRTPLSVVQGNLRAILDDVYPLEKAEIARLYDETRLLNRLVDDLRDLALADAGQLRLDLVPIDLASEIQATTGNLTLAAEAQGVSLTARVPGDLPPAQADPDRLAQVLRNLLVNALRHTLAGGSVVVAAAQTGDRVEITVADTGEGIRSEDLDHVFERFWRADLSRARAQSSQPGGGELRWAGGSGLGLSVARSLVEAQGGRIWFESTLAEGTTFYFTLPLAEVEPEA